MKITTAEFKEWSDTAWPAGYVWSDDSALDDGRDIYQEDSEDLIFAPGDVFTVPSWWSVIDENDTSKDALSIRVLIREWRKDRSSERFVVTVPKDQVDGARALFAEHKWSVASGR